LDVEPVMEQTIGPTLGRDTIEKGTRSIFVAMIAVLVFVLIYYLHFAGTVADICLVLNLLLVVGTMSLIDATFTLPGLAGLVLTVGMSIDANVLIFERIREEQDRGGQLRVAIRNGFARAYRTIIDSNITTLLTAFILYGIGTDQVKGFAVTLIIGILMSMFTAMFVSRLVFEIFERKGWIKRVRMLRIVGHTRIDFLAKWVPCATVSCVLIVLGVLVVGLRGSSMLDIDFTGGTAIAIRLAEPESTEEVRRLAREIPDATVEDLSVGGERPEEGRFVRFLIRTTEQDPDGVKAKIIDAFGDRLVRVRMDYGTVEEVPGDASPGGQASSETPSDSDPSTKTTATSTEALPHRFAGGSRVDLSFSEPLSTAAAKRYFAEFFATAENLATAELQIDVTGTEAAPGTDNQFVKMSLETSFASSRLDAALDQVQARLAEEPLFDRVNNFGGQVAGETTQLAVFAMLASFAAIVGYLWFRFQAVTFGLAAVAALAHDVLIVLGLVALSGWLTQGPAGFVGSVLLLDPFKIDLPMIAAFLTLVGYSLNDTIVVFDRIREVRGKNPDITKDMINVSVNQTLSRTLLTSFTTWLVVAILYVWGGEGIHGFAFCLVTGIIVGTYSSIYIASPLLVWLSSRKKSTSRAGRRSRSKKPVPVAEST
jgi:SecD/SecF fusion protein